MNRVQAESTLECKTLNQVHLLHSQHARYPRRNLAHHTFLSFNQLFALSSPIFEEDTPSVMEIEMEELDKWMSMHRNGM